MSIQDFIKKSILECGAFDGASLTSIALGLVTALMMGTVIYAVYSNFYAGDEAGDNVIRIFGKMKCFIKSKTVRNDKAEMAAEVYCKDNDMFFLDRIRNTEGVEDATLIQYNGEYHG